MLAEFTHSVESSDTDVITHSVTKKIVSMAILSNDMYFSSLFVVPLCSNFMAVEHIIIRMHFITRIASMDSHNPGQSLITNVDCVL